MKNKNNLINPIGLKGQEVINRMKSLMGDISGNESINRYWHWP